ncbi:ankyrin repeat domain-containing protein [Dongia sp.]|uniref:ankyrin repeat domain-containing protein n=1 Tax=Dongia sp. TaxID=1977262 RepID=UPI0035AFD883
MRAAFGLAAFASGLALHSAFAGPIEPTTYPFLPSLTVNNEPAVCGAFESVVIEAFKGPQFQLSLADSYWPETKVQSVVFTANGLLPTAEAKNVTLNGVETLVGEGRWILAHVIQHAPMQDAHLFMLFADQASYLAKVKEIENVRDQYLDFEQAFADVRDVVPVEVPQDIEWIEEPSWGEHAFFIINDALYMVGRNNRTDPTELDLWRIHATSTKLACRVDLSTENQLTFGPVGHLHDLLRAISGEEPYYGGTMHTLNYVQLRGSPVVSRIALRPWSLSDFEPFASSADVDAWLDYWGQASLWNHRQWRKMEALKPAALNALAGYFRDAFGLSGMAALNLAQTSIERLMGCYFMFPASLHDLDLDNPRWRLRHALLAGAPWAEIAQLLPLDKPMGPQDWGWFEVEPSLDYALEHPTLLSQLLGQNSDPDAANGFGKTPLMYAAHFNLPKAAKLLLQHGANVNAQTGRKDKKRVSLFNGTTYRIDRWSRTPLMYALENADIDMVALLLDAGADPQAQDSSGGDAMDYLQRNVGLSSTEREQVAKLLRNAGYVGSEGQPQ